IADRMALFCDPVFQNPEGYSTGAVWVAVLAFAIRIYCDFSGYTDMAIGCAHLLGFRLTQNFNMPYIAKNVSEFWRRWHISLSTWLRDYLFIPLGGSRGTRWLVCRNLMITMTLGGLWHGANWSFLLWGVLHGLLLVGHRFFREFAQARPRLDGLLQTLPGTAFRMGLTFFCVMMCWVFFQPSLSVSMTMLERMFVPHEGLSSALNPRSLWYTLAFMALCHYVAASGIWRTWSFRIPSPVMGFGYAAALTLALLLTPDAGKSFIYFQF
ncbi:MAG TPA: MBOAT family O-acyltransferase, partial [Gemmataceae bacterium]